MDNNSTAYEQEKLLEMAHSPHTLLVEDDATGRMTIGRLLESTGHCVTTASDGKTALILLQQQAFDMVISDVQLGDIDGFQVLRAAKSLARPPAVIFITGDSNLDSVIAALRGGVSDYILKPVNIPDFIDRVRTALRRHAAEMVQRDALYSIMQVAARLQEEMPLHD